MVNWNLWAFFVATEAVLCVTPGPAVLFVVSHGISQGGRASLAANAGILTGNTLYFVLSALGVGALLLASERLFSMLTLAGAAYLVLLGIQTIRGAGLALPAAGSAGADSNGWTIWLRATALQMANPKALVFFIALLPQFLDRSLPLAPQIAVFTATSVAIEFAVLAAYGSLAARASRFAEQRRFRLITNGIAGVMLLAAGAGIAWR